MNKICFTIILFLASTQLYGAACTDVFPDAVSNTQNVASISFGWEARVNNSPDGVLDTTNLIDNSGGVSCDSAGCTSSGNLAETGDYNSFVNNQPSITLGYQQVSSVTPGDYDSLTLNSEAELTMAPGVYTFRQTVTMQSLSEIIVGAPGTVIIYVREAVTFNSQTVVNAAAGDRQVFIFSRSDISVQWAATLNAVLYARGDVTLQNATNVTGAITTRGDIILNSGAEVNYSSSAIESTDFDEFCESAPEVPDPIGEWRLDEGNWNGTANEVMDSSVNGLHGAVVGLDGLPGNEDANPVRDGSPGTCRYGDFDGRNDGYIEIPDPGFDSILDLDDEFTVAVWVYARSNATSGLATIVSKDENFEFHINGSGQINWWWGGGSRSLTTSQSLTLNTWNHISITFRSGEQHIYINGVSAADTNSSAAITVNNDSLFFGTDWNFHSRRFDGLIDEVKIYDSALSAEQIGVVMNEDHACANGASLDHFNIDVGSGNTSVCAPTTIDISARDASDNVLTSYTGTIDLTTSTNNGDWAESSVLGVFTPGIVDSGMASYEYEIGGLDEGEISLELDNQHAETLTVTITDSSQGISTTSASIAFSENAFRVVENDNLDEDIIAGRRHQFNVLMFLREPGASECSVATNYNASDVKAWISRSGADPGGTEPTMFNSDDSASSLLVDTELTAQTIELGFSSGVASFSVETSDVGQYAIEFYDDSLQFSDQAIRGGSNSLTARPFAFEVVATGNPGAESAIGDAYLEAGEPFDVSVRAVAWDALDDANDDGIPDVYADSDLTNNNVLRGATLPRFGLEAPAETVTLTASIVAPSLQNPGLGDNGVDGNVISGFTSGTATAADRYFSEVGIISISAGITGDYLGASSGDTDKATSTSISIGRFIPSYFELANSTFDSSCLTFTYLQHPRRAELSIEARNRFDQLTRNYTGDFAKLTQSAQVAVGAIDSVIPTPLSARTSSSSTFNWTDGAGDIQSDIVLARVSPPNSSNALYSDVNVGVNPTDSDGVTVQSASLNLDTSNDTVNDTVNIGQDEYRFGRLVLPSAHGPESAPLAAGFVTQYWSGTGWINNGADSCTLVPAMAIYIEGSPIDSAANLTNGVGGGSTTASFTDHDLTRVAFQNGDAGLVFSAPGAGNIGSVNVDVDVSTLPWLQFDWNQDGAYTDSVLPTAEFRFGSYRGHDRIIYWQEVLSN